MTIIFVIKNQCCTKEHLEHFLATLRELRIKPKIIKLIYQLRNKPKVIVDYSRKRHSGSRNKSFFEVTSASRIILVATEFSVSKGRIPRKIKYGFRNKFNDNGCMHCSDDHTTGAQQLRKILNPKNDILYLENTKQRIRSAKYGYQKD